MGLTSLRPSIWLGWLVQRGVPQGTSETRCARAGGSLPRGASLSSKAGRAGLASMQGREATWLACAWGAAKPTTHCKSPNWKLLVAWLALVGLRWLWSN